MAGVTQLGYWGFEVSDLAAWETFATDVLGLAVAARQEDGGLRLRLDEHSWRIALEPGPADDLAYVGFEPTAFVPDISVLADAGVDNRVSVGGVVRGADSFGSGDGALGTVRFSIQPGLAERGQLLVTQFAYRPVGGGEIVSDVLIRANIERPPGWEAAQDVTVNIEGSIVDGEFGEVEVSGEFVEEGEAVVEIQGEFVETPADTSVAK